jgi:hypothetical protein
MPNTAPIGFHWCPQRFFRSYYIKEDLHIYEIGMDSVREKTSASNEPICKEEKGEFLIANDCCSNLLCTDSILSFSYVFPNCFFNINLRGKTFFYKVQFTYSDWC